MLTEQRKQAILALLAQEGQVFSGELSQRYDVSEDTIRRDLRELAAEGKLQRVHGGALPASRATAGFAERVPIESASKRALAAGAARMIAPGQVVLLDGGTTALTLARLLPADLNATVVTHSPNVAVALVDHPGIEVVLIGGKLYKHSIVSVGSAALEALAPIRADLFFMGVTGVHPSAGFSTGDLEEAYMKRALAAHAAETVVLASAEKLHTASRYRIGGLEMASAILVEADTDEALLAPLRNAGGNVVST